MSLTGRVKRAVTGLAGGQRRSLRVSDETKVRFAAAALWVLVVAAGLGGLAALIRPAPAPPGEQTPVESPASTVSEAQAAAGFGARAIAAYLTTDPDPQGEGGFGAFLGNGQAPEPTDSADAPPVAVVATDRVGEAYWAVTVAAGEAGREEFWRAGVVSRDGRLVATGLPTPVATPAVAEQPEPAVRASERPPGDDPVADTVTGWVTAYACGQGDVSRWLAPGVRLDPVTPPLCDEARIERWGTRPDGEDRQVVVTEAALDPGASERRVTFALALTRRDGRWEITDLLPAPPLSEEEH